MNADGISTTAWFDYGISSGVYTGSSTTQLVTGTSTTAVAISLDGLSGDTAYYYRIGAQNSFGASYGAESSFITANPNLRAVTGTATSATFVPVFLQEFFANDLFNIQICLRSGQAVE